MDILERLAILTIADWVKMTIQIQIYILVVSKCMLIVFRPPFEVVKEGRILYLVSGYWRFLADKTF